MNYFHHGFQCTSITKFSPDVTVNSAPVIVNSAVLWPPEAGSTGFGNDTALYYYCPLCQDNILLIDNNK